MYSIDKKVGFGDVGPDGRMNISTIVDACQKCCGFQLDDSKVTQEFYERCNSTTFLLFRQMDIIERPAYGQNIKIDTTVFEMKLAYGLRNTMIYDEDGKVMIASYVGGATVDKSTGKPVAYPKDLLERLNLGDKYEDMEYLPRKVKIPKGVEGEKLPDFPVYRYMIDENRHVNNAKYLDVVQEYVPEGFEIGRLRIAYMLPAKYGDTFHPVRYMYDDKVFLSLQDEEGNPYVNIELTEKA